MTAVYLQLAAYACATTFSPGPNNILLFSSTSRYGIRKCWPLIFGIWAGLITVMLLCGFGCAWLGELVPQIVPVAKYVGAAYILYLAYRTLMQQPRRQEGGRPLRQAAVLCERLPAAIPERSHPDAGDRRLFRLYPASWVYGASRAVLLCHHGCLRRHRKPDLGHAGRAAVPAVQPVLQICQRRYGAAPALVRLENHLRLRIHGPNALPSREGVFCAEQASPHLFILYNVGRARLRRHPEERFLGDREAVRADLRKICANWTPPGA